MKRKGKTNFETTPQHNGVDLVRTDDSRLHSEAHTVVSHSDTTATGTQLNELVGGGETSLHSHAAAGGLANDIASATGVANTSNTSDELVGSMTLTPASGTYLVWFSGSVSNSGSGEATYLSIYAGGVQDADSEREATRGASQGNVTLPFSSNGKVTVNGSQAIEGRWRVSGGTATINQRNLIILKVA